MRRGIACVLALLSFSLHFALAFDFDRIGALGADDWLFDADPSTRLQAFSENRHLGIKHPNLMPYFSPAVGAAAWLMVRLAPSRFEEGDVRRRLGTLVVPAASGLATALLFLLFGRLGYRLAAALVATLLAQVSFGSLIFGTIPESYGLTALVLALSYVYATGSGRELDRGRVMVWWFALGVFATGVTITNLVYVLIFVVVITIDRGEGVVVAATRAAVLAIAIFAVTGGSAWLLDRLLVRPLEATGTSAPPTLVARITRPAVFEVNTFSAGDPLSKLEHFPTSIANAVAPSSVAWLSQPPPHRGQGFTLERTASVLGSRDPLGTSIVLLLVTGTLCALVDTQTRATAAASLLVLAFGAVLSIWGTEAFLYSQGWQPAAQVLIAASMRPRRTAPWITAALAVLTLAVAINNAATLNGMFSTLEAIPH